MFSQFDEILMFLIFMGKNTVAKHNMQLKLLSHFSAKIPWKQQFYYLKKLPNSWFDDKKFSVRVNFSFFHTNQSGNYRNLLSRIFDKIFVKVTVLLKHSVESTAWKLRKFSLVLFWQKFRESNIFTKK